MLVLGHTDGGWLDLIIASLLTLLGGSETGGVYGGVGIFLPPGVTEIGDRNLREHRAKACSRLLTISQMKEV